MAGTYYLGGYGIVSSPLAWTTANGTTTNWSDGSAGDTSTFNGAGAPGYSAFYDNGAAGAISAAQFTCQLNNASVGNPTAYLLEGSNDTTTWTSISSGNTVAVGNGSTGVFGTNSLTGLSGTYRYYRLTIGSPFSPTGSPGLQLSDWRMTIASGTTYNLSPGETVNITDAVVMTKGQADDGLLKRLRFYLSWDGTTTAGTPKVANQPTSGLSWLSQGSTTDTWSASPTPALVNGSGFTVFVEVPRDLANESAVYRLLDSLRVTIYHNAPAGTSMAIRETAKQHVIIGKEATLGTSVTPTVRLRHARIQPQPKPTFKNYATPGEKLDSHYLVMKEEAEGPLEGIPTYDEIGYLLASAIAAQNTTVLQASSAYRHTFFLDNRLRDAFVSYTAQYGDPVVRAHQITGMVLHSLDLTLRQDAAEIAGTVLGQLLNDPVTMAPGAATVQTLTQSGTGTFRLAWRGQETADLTAGASLTATAIQTALQALAGITGANQGQLTVSGAAGGPFTITFGNGSSGPFYGVPQPMLTIRTTAGSPVASVALTTVGGFVTVPGVPILPRHLEVWLSSTYSNIGITAGKLTDCYVSNFGIHNRAATVFNLDRLQTSWYGLAEPENLEVAANIIVNANSNGMAFLPLGRSDTLMWLRILATGPLIGATSLPHRLQIDIPVKISGYGPFADNQGTYAHEYKLMGTYDPSLNQSLVITLDNGVSGY